MHFNVTSAIKCDGAVLRRSSIRSYSDPWLSWLCCVGFVFSLASLIVTKGGLEQLFVPSHLRAWRWQGHHFLPSSNLSAEISPLGHSLFWQRKMRVYADCFGTEQELGSTHVSHIVKLHNQYTCPHELLKTYSSISLPCWGSRSFSSSTKKPC